MSSDDADALVISTDPLHVRFDFLADDDLANAHL